MRPTTGDVEWLLLPSVNTITFNIALAHFAKAVGASETKRIVLDGAGWHKSGAVDWPVGVHPLFLREAPANRLLRSLDELEALLVNRCQKLTAMPKHIRGCTRFPWWPDAMNINGHWG